MKKNLKKIQQKFTAENILQFVKSNKKKSAILAGLGVFLFYVMFNSNGIVQRLRLERQKKNIMEKIQETQEEQQKLRNQSQALEGDKKAIEKIAREKYGMVREGEKVYKVVKK